jgi:hypothetical protein
MAGLDGGGGSNVPIAAGLAGVFFLAGPARGTVDPAARVKESRVYGSS